MRKYLVLALLGCTVFGLMFLFYTEIHPVVMYDSDDWRGLARQRTVAFPKWGDHNPIKVLPETLMPTTGLFAAYILTPLTGDYVGSITLATALLLALFIAVYVCLFVESVKRKFGLPCWSSATLGLIFLALHFLCLRHTDYNNLYILYSVNLTCHYNYVIPFLCAASLLFYFMVADVQSDYRLRGDRFSDVCLASAIFLVIFSSILHSTVFMSFILTELFWRQLKQNKFNFRGFYQKNKFFVKITLVWLISLLFEATGGNSQRIGKWESLSPAVTLSNLAAFIGQPNKGLYILWICVFLFAAIAAYIYRRQKIKNELSEMDCGYRNLMLKTITAALFWLLINVPICTAADPTYIVRIDVTSGLFFFILLLAFWSMAYVFSRRPHASLVIPILFLVIVSRTVNTGESLLSSNVYRIPPKYCEQVTRYMIEEIKAADIAGADTLNLHVPVGFAEGNWPISLHTNETMIRMLYGHGQISRPLKLVLVPDEELNVRFHIPKQNI